MCPRGFVTTVMCFQRIVKIIAGLCTSDQIQTARSWDNQSYIILRMYVQSQWLHWGLPKISLEPVLTDWFYPESRQNVYRLWNCSLWSEICWKQFLNTIWLCSMGVHLLIFGNHILTQKHAITGPAEHGGWRAFACHSLFCKASNHCEHFSNYQKKHSLPPWKMEL